MSDGELERLGEARYVSLSTFRRDGREVPTPVWVARAGDRLYVFTEGDAGKVKRIRATGRIRLCPCDLRGGLPAEPRFSEGRGRIVPRQEEETWRRATDALRAKYGWQMALVDLVSRLAGRFPRRAVLELRLGGEGPGTPPAP